MSSANTSTVMGMCAEVIEGLYKRGHNVTHQTYQPESVITAEQAGCIVEDEDGNRYEITVERAQ